MDGEMDRQMDGGDCITSRANAVGNQGQIDSRQQTIHNNLLSALATKSFTVECNRHMEVYKIKTGSTQRAQTSADPEDPDFGFWTPGSEA